MEKGDNLETYQLVEKVLISPDADVSKALHDLFSEMAERSFSLKMQKRYNVSRNMQHECFVMKISKICILSLNLVPQLYKVF